MSESGVQDTIIQESHLQVILKKYCKWSWKSEGELSFGRLLFLQITTMAPLLGGAKHSPQTFSAEAAEG